jgi:DNA repair exonuclease SbcCD nuclease subunit
MFKFLHAADIHLDSQLRGLDRYEGAPVDECRGATRRALENLVQLAVDERVALVLIVGDLYDGDWRDFNTGLFFAKQMDRLRDEGIQVVMIRGNHDAASAITKYLPPKPNVKILSHGKAETHRLDDIGLALHGQSFATRAVSDNLALGYPRPVPGLFNIGLLHTGVDGREGHEPYAPCHLDDMRRLGYDYWALGHIHKRETLHDAVPFIAFSGNLQGRNVRETGPKGCLLVSIDESHHVSQEFRELDVVRWEICRVDASGANGGDEILARFREQLATLSLTSDDRLRALRVEVKGTCRAHTSVSAKWHDWVQEIRQIAAEASGGRVWIEKVTGRTTSPESPRKSQDDGPLDELADYLDELQRNDTLLGEIGGRELADIKRKLDPTLFDDLDKPERLREVLSHVGPMLVSRLDGHPRRTGEGNPT